MKVVVGQGSCGIATGAKKTAAELEKQIAERGLDVKVDITGALVPAIWNQLWMYMTITAK